MIIIRAGSLAEAREIAASDPMHASGARTVHHTSLADERRFRDDAGHLFGRRAGGHMNRMVSPLNGRWTRYELDTKAGEIPRHTRRRQMRSPRFGV